ncbi:MAG: HD domain-containing protein [Patescibacteria group bacterium]|nr:HD domain-containing protein [Patescibacteria group bacterium]
MVFFDSFMYDRPMDILRHIKNRSLAHIVRYSAHPQHFGESVAEHSFYTAYITAILCRLLKEEEVEINTEKAISMALVHDAEEMFSGDILGPFKHYSEEVTSAIRKVNLEIIQDAFEGLPESLSNHFIALWTEEGEGESIEAQVVKKADRLSLIAKCAEEVHAGNEFFKEMYENQLALLNRDDKPWWNKIKAKVLSSMKEDV